MSTRGNQWKVFSKEVEDHIENYTVPQYGDYPDDQATDFTVQDLVTQMKRYLNRAESNAREGERLRDCLKLAHYANLLYLKQLS